MDIITIRNNENDTITPKILYGFLQKLFFLKFKTSVIMKEQDSKSLKYRVQERRVVLLNWFQMIDHLE